MEPSPKQVASLGVPLRWPTTSAINVLPLPPPPESFAQVLLRRRSARVISCCSLRDLVSAISFATRSLYVRRVADAERFRRPSPSAGGLHPLHVLLASPSGAARVFLADPDKSRLVCLAVTRPEQMDALRDRRHSILPHARGYLLVLAGNMDLLGAHYENSETLFWRDAGALAQTLALTFEAYRLKSCLMGVSGSEMVKAIGMENALTAAGAMVVGASE